ncbi:MAG: alpha/beta hydrolase [Candidatus Marinimicrobia bacterium]|nr:alpha/beta hydrolase [Candidatus Neomarinimicrobiota bacterium]
MKLVIILSLIVIIFLGVTSASPVLGQVDTDVNSKLGEVHVIGTGPTILLIIPCASCRWRSFEEFAERNARRFTTIAVTLPGYGGTPAPDLPTFGEEAHWQPYVVDALEQLLEEEDLSGVIVIGHSFGTRIALQIAVRRPDRIRGLINLDGTLAAPLERESQSLEVRLTAAAEIRTEYMDPLSDPDAWQRFNLPRIDRQDRRILYHGWFMATDRTAMTQYWWENLLESWNPLLRKLSMPVLDVQLYNPGTRNVAEKQRNYRERVEALKLGENYRLLFYRDTGHFLMEDRPELLDILVITFAEGRTDYPEK